MEAIDSFIMLNTRKRENAAAHKQNDACQDPHDCMLMIKKKSQALASTSFLIELED